MEDLAYRHFIESHGPYGYALFFRKLRAFDPAQEALERALVHGYLDWLEVRPQEPFPAAAWLADLVARTSTAPGTELETPAGLLARSQKLQLLDQALELLRGLSEFDQVVVILRHVEEVPEERICGWLGLAPVALGQAEDRLKERLVAWPLPPEFREEPSAFFLRALRQHRLPANFCDRILSQIPSPPIDWDRPLRAIGWVIALGCPFILFPLLYNRSLRMHDYGSDGIWDEPMLGLSIQFVVALSAVFLHQALSRHAPAPVRRSVHPLLLSILGVAGMSGMGLVTTGMLFRLQALRLPKIEPLSLIYPAWLLGSIFLILLTTYQVGVYYLKCSVPTPVDKPPGGPR